MHYAGFAHPVMEWLSGRDLYGNPVKLEAEELWRALLDHYQALPLQLRHSMYTLLSSHDIPRALWRLKGDKERFKTAYASSSPSREAPPSTTGTRWASPSPTPTGSGGETPTAAPPSPGTRPSGTGTSSPSSGAGAPEEDPSVLRLGGLLP